MNPATIQSEIQKHKQRIAQLRLDWKNEKSVDKKKFIVKLAELHKDKILTLEKRA